ncbi:MAG: malto-oligosyltrehalose trehalohydrolase [Rhodospirillales bacterium]|nr:malto-oligosyltrehalose trehalohydrolase [Rhodospirillales bacterium]
MTSFRHRMPFGAELGAAGVRFRLWAPDAQAVALCVGEGRDERVLAMDKDSAGWCELTLPDAGAGTRYRYQIDGDLKVPDPASRYQPDDVHGASAVVDPAAYVWKNPDWRGRAWEDAVFYELHVGTFSPEGTFRGVADRLAYLKDLGVTAVELMPVADFPGARDWGYDGVALYAPDSIYGRPDDLKALIDAAHGLDLMVFLDVVYNHFGPEGNYLHAFARRFFNPDRHTPWGAAINFDAADSRVVRDFFIHNTLYWLEEYRFDGLRFDAVHAIEDTSSPDFLTELAETVHARISKDRLVHLVLENDKNESRYLDRDDELRPRHYDAQWNDDVHHAYHVLTTGEGGGYYEDYADRPGAHLARCLTEGFAYQADPSPFRKGEIRGEPSAGLPATAFVSFIQNHDQVGNRAFGDRINHLVSPEALRAASVILLLAPAPPMLFMGQEWASARPFLFFCNLGPDLEEPVREGRRREFASFPEFSDPEARAKIPDPNAPETFEKSKLDWAACETGKHAEILALHRELLGLRQRELAPRLQKMPGGGTVAWCEGAAMKLVWPLGDGSTLTLVANMADRAVEAPTLEANGEVLYATAGFDTASPIGRLPAWAAAYFLERA